MGKISYVVRAIPLKTYWDRPRALILSPVSQLLIFTLLIVIARVVLINILIHISHPITLGVVLVLYSLLIGGMSMFFRFPWFFYLLVLVFLGGVIVLIIYIRTLSANEKFIPGPSLVGPAPLLMGIVLRFLLFFEFSYANKSRRVFSYVSHIYEYCDSIITIFLMAYLLITIVCVVKLVKFERGPLVGRL